MQTQEIQRHVNAFDWRLMDKNHLIDPSAQNHHDRKGEVVQLPSILIVRWDDVGIDSISTLFENRGYLVTRLQASSFEGSDGTFDSNLYEAIVHTARFAETLEDKLSETVNKTSFVEHALIAKDEIDDVHCVVQLKPHASIDLKAYVMSLWAMCTVT